MKIKDSFFKNYLDAALKDAPTNRQVSILEQIEAFSKALSNNQNIWLFLNSPLMSAKEKAKFLETFSKNLKFDQIVLNFFAMLLKNKRLESIKSLISMCRERQDKLKSINNVLAVSSEEITEQQFNMLTKKLLQLGFRNVNLKTKVDKTLVFGFKLFTENKVYDLSLKSMFENVRENILKTN